MYLTKSPGPEYSSMADTGPTQFRCANGGAECTKGLTINGRKEGWADYLDGKSKPLEQYVGKKLLTKGPFINNI